MPGMCGRFANSETIPVMAGRWAAQVATGAEAWEPNTDIRPTRRVPVLLEGPAERPRRLGLMTWGWSRDFASSGKLINARIEDAAGKRTFAEAVQRRRCLLPATAWFEWKRADPDAKRGAKQLLRPEGLETWAMAGLWESTPEGSCVVVLTTAAHASIADIHDRMPVVFTPERATTWITGSAESALALAAAVPASGKADPPA